MLAILTLDLKSVMNMRLLLIISKSKRVKIEFADLMRVHRILYHQLVLLKLKKSRFHFLHIVLYFSASSNIRITEIRSNQ